MAKLAGDVRLNELSDLRRQYASWVVSELDALLPPDSSLEFRTEQRAGAPTWPDAAPGTARATDVLAVRHPRLPGEVRVELEYSDLGEGWLTAEARAQRVLPNGVRADRQGYLQTPEPTRDEAARTATWITSQVADELHRHADGLDPRAAGLWGDMVPARPGDDSTLWDPHAAVFLGEVKQLYQEATGRGASQLLTHSDRGHEHSLLLGTTRTGSSVGLYEADVLRVVDVDQTNVRVELRHKDQAHLDDPGSVVATTTLPREAATPAAVAVFATAHRDALLPAPHTPHRVDARTLVPQADAAPRARSLRSRMTSRREQQAVGEDDPARARANEHSPSRGWTPDARDRDPADRAATAGAAPRGPRL